MTKAGSRLDREHTVLVIVDVQDRLAAAMTLRDRVVSRAQLLVEAASITGCPIVVTRQYPRGLGDVVTPLLDVLERVEAEGATVSPVEKLAFNCFAEETFAACIEAIGRRQLLVAGMETHICVTQTALAGLEQGFDIHVAADACCSREAYAHDVAVTRMSRAGVAVTTAESAAYELVSRAGTPEFKALLKAVKA